jgi:hypothetical protein
MKLLTWCLILVINFIFHISCKNNSSKQQFNEPHYKLTVYVSVNNVKLCLHSIQNFSTQNQKTCMDSYLNETPCMIYGTDIPFFSMPPKEAADIIFKGISELQIINPKIARKLEKIVIFNIDYKDVKTKEVLSKFEKELESILKNSKIYVIVKRLDPEETTNLFFESAIYDYPILDNDFYYLFTGENNFHLLQFKNKTIVSNIYDNLGYDILFERGENYRKEFFSCRQIISNSLDTLNSGWENFEDCKLYIQNRILESKLKTFFEKNTPETKNSLYAIGGIWTDTGKYYSKTYLSRKEIKESIRKSCKYTTVELLNNRYNKNISYKLCYNLSYIDTFLELLKMDSVKILPESNLSSSGAIFSGFFPECSSVIKQNPKKK